jgi:hypothetical protein
MTTYDLLTVINILASGGATLLLIVLAIRRRHKFVYSLVALFTAYMFVFYSYILICDPVISVVTAGVGRAGILLLLAGICMLAILADEMIWTPPY